MYESISQRTCDNRYQIKWEIKICWYFNSDIICEIGEHASVSELFMVRLFIRAKSSLIQSSCRSFIRVIVPYEISKVNFHVETKILILKWSNLWYASLSELFMV
jgi:hypothetical protein